MITSNEQTEIRTICTILEKRLKEKHIGCFEGCSMPLLLISAEYPGLWLEHVYDSILYAKLYPEYLFLAKNAISVFIDHQTEEGQYPCFYRDAGKSNCKPDEVFGYSQIQECVSFVQLCLEVCEMINDFAFTEKVYNSAQKWVGWLRKYRMTQGLGLVEMFVGYDTGHDCSGRLTGLTQPGCYFVNGKRMNASVLPPNDDVAPIIAVDMNCNFYGNLRALAKLAKLVGKDDKAIEWEAQADEVKKRLFALCYDKEDAFFYDVDKHGRKRKYLSSSIFHLFLEKVLSKEKDKELIQEIYERHIKNPNEFWTEYPFPSMAISDPSCVGHKIGNCWGYYSQALIALRCIRWMDDYGFTEDFDTLCAKWLKAWTACYGKFHFGQELDPITGEPSPTSEWYSSCMLFYLYAAKRLGI